MEGHAATMQPNQARARDLITPREPAAAKPRSVMPNVPRPSEAIQSARKLREQLESVEKELVAEREAHTRHAAEVSAEISSLQRELAWATSLQSTQILAAPSDSPEHLRWPAIVTCVAIVVIALTLMMFSGGVKLYRPVPSPPAKAIVKPAEPRRGSEEAEALNRLNRALALVPSPAVPGVLTAANEWLATRGQRPCSVQSGGGGMALVLAPGDPKQGALVASLLRCADAIEHLIH
jgi:hypothetical protein